MIYGEPRVFKERSHMHGQAATLPAIAASDDAADLTEVPALPGHLFSFQRRDRARFRLGRPPLWIVSVAVLLILLLLTLALWRAETSLENLGADHAHLTHRGSRWVIWGGLSISALTALLVYLTILHRSRDHDLTRRYLRALETLQNNAASIIARVDAGQAALKELCESARQVLKMDRAGIQVLDAAAARLELLASSGDMPENPPRYYPLDGLPIIRSCFETGKVFFAEDIEQLDIQQNRDVLDLFRVRSMMLIPLTIGAEQIGMMTLSSSTPRKGFDEVERRLAQVLGSQAAVVLANNRLYQAQQSSAQKYKSLVDQRELLYSTNASIFQTAGLEESLKRIAELAPLALGVDACVVALSAKPPDNVRIAAVTPGTMGRGTLKAGMQFFCPAAERAFQRGVACVFGRAQDDPDVAHVREAFPDMGSMACVPMSGRDGARLGVLGLIRRQAGVFSPEQLKMARLFSTRAATAIENAKLYQETRRALEAQKKLLAQRDALWTVNAALYQAGTLEETLERIVQLAPKALGVDLCAVDMTTEREGEIVLAAITDKYNAADLIGKTFEVNKANAGKVLRTREIMTVSDARTNPGVPRVFRERFNVQSVAYFPLLRNDGVPQGVLVLVRHQPGEFDPAQIEMARMFSTRAASAMENARLLEQTRRDAATKAMLLREVNHRVKNNLAGIVALLSMGEPEMPPAARRWLNRVTDRVRAMAGAHQLFLGDEQRVPLANLVERMLSSLSVARNAGVEMKLDLGAANDVQLRTEQAISLVMALHELCYNAIMHGLGGTGGSVTLRTRDAGQGRLAVDVIDNGKGFPSGNDNGEAGVGLEIVRGLVGRELHGSFSLSPAPGGGTIATVEFPLLGVGPEHHVS
jgi:GAF domain-containing protein